MGSLKVSLAGITSAGGNRSNPFDETRAVENFLIGFLLLLIEWPYADSLNSFDVCFQAMCLSSAFVRAELFEW